MKWFEILFCKYVWFSIKLQSYFHRDKRVVITECKETIGSLFCLFVFQLILAVIFALDKNLNMEFDLKRVIICDTIFSAIISIVIHIYIRRKLKRYRIIFNKEYMQSKMGSVGFAIYMFFTYVGLFAILGILII